MFTNASSRLAQRDTRSGSEFRFSARSWPGLSTSASRARNLEIVERNVNLFRLWPYTVEAARVYGKLFAELRRIGRPMQAIDLQIAAIALSLGNCTVVTTDTDLSAVRAMSVESWAS